MREGATTESKRPTAGDSVTQVELPAVHRPPAMEVALDDEIERLERMVLLAWQATAVVGVLVVPGFKLDAMLLTPLLFLVWFHGVTYLPKGGTTERIARTWLTPAVESAVPWVALLPIMHANGPQYALGSASDGSPGSQTSATSAKGMIGGVRADAFPAPPTLELIPSAMHPEWYSTGLGGFFSSP